MKAFLLCHSSIASPEYVQAVLSSTRAVTTWVAPFPYSAIVISELTLNELTGVMEVHLNGSWFLLTELSSTNSNGLLPEQLWTYVQEPSQAWRQGVLAEIERKVQSSAMVARPPGRVTPEQAEHYLSRLLKTTEPATSGETGEERHPNGRR